MEKLVLTFNKQIIKKYSFDKDNLTIGRKPENDVQIDNLAVSGHHARIDRTGTEFILTDLQSTNGTFVNHKQIVSHTLKHGDNIQIGKHILLFLASEKKETGVEEPVKEPDLDKTMILDTVKQRELLAKQAKPGVPPPAAATSEKIGVLSALGGSDLGEIELTKKLTRIGKADTSEIRLSGMMMGATAATISKRPSGYTIAFTGGRTKLKVNGQVVQDSMPLKDFDTIEIGSHKFQFYQKEAK
jgi:pSer/pThr/pTyr-binding forkhead associated (FHA) protein